MDGDPMRPWPRGNRSQASSEEAGHRRAKHVTDKPWYADDRRTGLSHAELRVNGREVEVVEDETGVVELSEKHH